MANKTTTALTGRKEIQGFVGRSWETIKEWYFEDDFPMKMIKGRWESDKDLILSWRKEQIIKVDKA